MKRKFLFAAVISFLIAGLAAYGLCSSETTNLGLTKPAKGDRNWGPTVNNNMDLLDAAYGNYVTSADDLPEVYVYADTFNSTTGRTITLPKSVSGVNEYDVKITPTSRAGAIGDIWVTKTTTNFVVKCSEANTTDTFSASVYYIGDVTSYGGSIYRRWYVSTDSGITDHGDSAIPGSLAWVAAQISTSPAVIEMPGNKTYQLKQNLTLDSNISYQPQPGAIIDTILSIRDSNYDWYKNGATDEYYLQASGGGNPNINIPSSVVENGSDMTDGLAGSLAAGEWDWNDVNGLGYTTIYVRLSDSTDPDGKAADYVKAQYLLTMNASFSAGLYPVFTTDANILFGPGAVKEVYPQWWGENTIPGTTDMTAAIQAASTAAGISRKVFFPDGTYLVTDAGGLPITYDPRVMFEGASREGVVIQNSSSTKYTFQYHSSVGDAYTAFDNPGGFKNMEIYAKFGIKFNQSLAEIGGIYTGDWNKQDITLGWDIHNISFKGDDTASGDVNANTDTEPAGISDYTTYGVGLFIVRPYHTEVHQCAFRNHGVGIFMEGADATLIDHNRFIYNSIHIYGTNGTDSTWGYNSKLSHNDFLTFYRRRAIWLEGQMGKFAGWTISDNFFEESGAEAEYIYVNAGYMHKIHSNLFGGTNHATTPMLNFVGDGYGHLIHSNSYGIPATDPIINVDWITDASVLTRRWIYFYDNSFHMPKPNYPRGIQKSPEDIQPFKFDCIENQDKWELGDAHNDDAPFVDFDGFPHLDTSQGSVDIYFRDDRVDRLTSFNLHIKGIITGGASGAENVWIAVFHDTTVDYNAALLSNVTDGDLVDVILPIDNSGAGYKRVLFADNLYLAISSIEIEPATPRYLMQTLTDADATPSVDGFTRAKTGTTGVTITQFNDGVEGQELTLISKGAIVFDTSTATRLVGSSVDITTASGDVTFWICEIGGTATSVWRLKGFVDVSADNSGGT